MRAALKWGALVGAGVYVIAGVALTLLATALFGPGVPGLDNPALFSSLCLGIFLLLFAFSAAGYFAGRETGRDGAGALAGMVAFVVYAVLSRIYSPSSVPTGAGAISTPTVAPTATATAAATATHVAATATAVAHATATAAASGGHPAQQAPPPSGVVTLLANLISFLLVLGIAALMGWLGGRPGAQRTRKAAAKATATPTE